MKRVIRATSERKHDPRMYSDEGYWFSTTHGIQPGSIPRDVEILDTYYGKYKSFVKLNRFLTTEELDFYDMKEEAPQGSQDIPNDLEKVTAGRARVTKKPKNAIDLDKLQKDIEAGVYRYMTGPSGGFQDDEVSQYSVVEVSESDERYDIEVRAELSYDGFMEMLFDELDPIVDSYSEGSYFEMEYPGIATCVIWKDEITSSEDIKCVQEFDDGSYVEDVIREGMFWDQDGHTFTVTFVSSKSCKIEEEWISEDTGRLMKDVQTYRIGKDDKGIEFAYLPKNPRWKFYSTSAFNAYHEADEPEAEHDDSYQYDDDDYYGPSSTGGDYSPSNPWDAPGMSIKDFI